MTEAHVVTQFVREQIRVIKNPSVSKTQLIDTRGIGVPTTEWKQTLKKEHTKIIKAHTLHVYLHIHIFLPRCSHPCKSKCTAWIEVLLREVVHDVDLSEHRFKVGVIGFHAE
jgi:hypothetical protein